MGKCITFWSPLKGRAGVTSAACAILTMTGMLCPEKTIALCSMDSKRSEIETKLESRGGFYGAGQHYEKLGMNALTMKYMQEGVKPDEIRSFGIPLLLDSLFLYSSGEQDLAFEAVKQKLIIDKINNEFDLLFLDLENGITEKSFSYMEKADVVVVVLPPEKRIWEEQDEWRRRLQGKKISLLLGKGIKESRYNADYFAGRRTKGKDKFLGVIPESAEYLDAMTERRTIEFFLKNRFSKKRDCNYDFIFQTKQAAEQLIRYCTEPEK